MTTDLPGLARKPSDKAQQTAENHRRPQTAPVDVEGPVLAGFRPADTIYTLRTMLRRLSQDAAFYLDNTARPASYFEAVSTHQLSLWVASRRIRKAIDFRKGRT